MNTDSQTSLMFKDSFTLQPITSSSHALQSITLKKRPDVQYPMIDGVMNWTQPEILAKNTLPQGFLILGCDISLNFDPSKI